MSGGRRGPGRGRPSRCRRTLGAVFVIFMQRREEGDRMISLKVVSKAPSCEMPDKAAPDKVHFILEVCFILASS